MKQVIKVYTPYKPQHNPVGAVKSNKNAKDQREGPLESRRSKLRKVSLFMSKRVETVQ